METPPSRPQPASDETRSAASRSFNAGTTRQTAGAFRRGWPRRSSGPEVELVGRPLRALPADVGLAGPDVVVVRAFDAVVVRALECDEVARLDRRHERRERVGVELRKLIAVLRSHHGERSLRAAHAAKEVSCELPVAAVGGMPARAVRAADARHQLPGAGERGGDVLE